MPKDTLDRAIKKGAGLTGEVVNYEHVIYEGFAPHQVAVMVECLTDNVKRPPLKCASFSVKASSAHPAPSLGF